jgi:hypothetical protein
MKPCHCAAFLRRLLSRQILHRQPSNGILQRRHHPGTALDRYFIADRPSELLIA